MPLLSELTDLLRLGYGGQPADEGATGDAH
jgi:hypothetical protein